MCDGRTDVEGVVHTPVTRNCNIFNKAILLDVIPCRILLLVRDGRTDVEGVVQATGPGAGSGAGGSRWVRDTQVGVWRWCASKDGAEVTWTAGHVVVIAV